MYFAHDSRATTKGFFSRITDASCKDLDKPSHPRLLTRPRGYENNFMLNSVEHAIFLAQKC